LQSHRGDGDLLDTLLFLASWELQGAPIPGGPPIHFTARCSPGEIGKTGFLLLSLGDGTSSGGISVPGTGERLGLDPDPLFGFWSTLPPVYRTVTLAGCRAPIRARCPFFSSFPAV